ncbi:hypothetical protein SCHPADRAFT_941486 [Schizopora paradoxa]|uniref:DUF6533 domain-containing protein n=1 Tax=Schizopora paradoxa TaxID=27342 RepID=A0A0H2RJA2_9AGAM|nr:hypothetical protein SCHPADRAFT_941486 [Schizopora paradoxa]
MRPSLAHFGVLSTKFVRSAETEAFHERLTNYVAIFGFTILVYDHLLTVSDEVRYIWSKPRGLVVYLFFLNRYFTPLSFIGNLIGACTIIAIEVAALMMLVRVKALYTDNTKIVWFIGSILVLETAVNTWLMTRAEAVPHEYDAYSCTMIFDPELFVIFNLPYFQLTNLLTCLLLLFPYTSNSGFWPSFSAWLPLIYDTLCILLTLWRCAGPLREHAAGVIVKTLVKDGAVYYSVIFCVNLVLAIMIVTAPPAIKNITAQLEQLLTVTMMSRITLSLKRQAALDHTSDEMIATRKTQPRMTFWRHPTINTFYSPSASRAVTRPPSPLDFASFGGAFSPMNLTGVHNSPSHTPPLLSPAISLPPSRGPSRRASRRSVRFSGVVTVLGDISTQTALDGEGNNEDREDASAESVDNSYDDGKRVSLLDLVPY